MNRALYIIAVLFLLLPASAGAQKSVDEANLSIFAPHPRLLADNNDFKEYKKALKDKKKVQLRHLHELYMEAAESFLKNDRHLTYSPNSSGKLLPVSRDALLKIFSCAYAYRITGNVAFLDRAESYLTDVCEFKTWHPGHFLDVAEMSTAVALGYDWLYNKLAPEVRENCERALEEFGLDPAEDPKHRKKFQANSNWGQVLNTGLICTCAAIYEKDPARCESLIRRAVKDNGSKVEVYYGPDGIYPEGAGYWAYGTGFQILTNLVLTKLYGSDFGMSDNKAFAASAEFMTFTVGNIGKRFNYSDSTDKVSANPQLWYFASRYGNYGVLYNELALEGELTSFKNRLGAMYLLCCAKCDPSKAVPTTKRVFSGKGPCPLVIARTGWREKDKYLAIKGGKANNNHGHMDAGSYIYESDGVRWACELGAPGYSKSEKLLKTMGKTPWKMSQNSGRWQVYGYNNQQHNTVTINGKDHIVSGMATLEEVYDSEKKMGGRLDMKEVFGASVAKAERTIVIKDGSYLEVTDVIAAPADSCATVRWTLISPAVPSVSADGIMLTSGKKAVKVQTTGATVEYGIWPTDPKECEKPFLLQSKRKTDICGFTVTIPAGQEVTLVTTMKEISQ